MSAALRASVRCAKPALAVDLDVPSGTTLGVIGPNGAGKSTLLAILAGLRRTGGSEVSVGTRILQSSADFVPPHQRSVVLLEQKARLFPHLSVRRNIGFGPAAAGLPRREVTARVRRQMAAVGVTDLADRMPSALSGGQAQRVALARALATDPDVLLLDEPFAALDVDVAQQMRTLLRPLLGRRSGCSVLVTHDLIDVVGLADQVLVIDRGRVVQRGDTLDVLTHPGTPFVASLSGMNLVLGEVAGPTSVQAPDGVEVIGTPIGGLVPDARAAAAFSPRSVALYPRANADSVAPQGSPRNAWPASVTEVIPRGEHALVRAVVAGHTVAAEVTWAAVRELGVATGSPVFAVVKASEVRIYAVG
ncbi:MAG: ATP-binding cassette domain-containing protein [Gordonia sp. (in: high G+C Gram-positive bacteria)]